jgi:two-component system, cell cycle sensor histidine kinase and response regulator CckA
MSLRGVSELSKGEMVPDSVTHSLVESLPEPHCVLSREFTCVSANTSFATLLGVSRESLVGAHASVFWPSAEKIPWTNREFSTEFIQADKSRLLVRIATYEGTFLVVRILSTFSENRSSEAFHGQRLETLGLLAGGVAHDFNNLLTGILGHLAYVRSSPPGSSSTAESLQAIEEGALRAASLTQQILRFSRTDAGETNSMVDVVDVVSRITVLMKSAIPSRVRLVWTPLPKPHFVMASEAYLSQVLINLVVNARDAIKGIGTIEVSVEPECSSAEVASLFGAEPPAARYCALIVKDSGEGMDEATKARLFEPYFTTKQQGGTGLGLTTVQSIVKQLGGAIDVDSELGRGATFRIVLPCAEEIAIHDNESSEDSGPVKGHGERILIIDDEYAVRNVLGLSLTHLGYQVESASTGEEGIEKYSAEKDSVDLVILDVLMPGLSGEEVFLRLRKLNPDVKVLLVSGFSSDEVRTRILEQGRVDFIQKPFLIDVLSRKVRGCLSD